MYLHCTLPTSCFHLLQWATEQGLVWKQNCSDQELQKGYNHNVWWLLKFPSFKTSKHLLHFPRANISNMTYNVMSTSLNTKYIEFLAEPKFWKYTSCYGWQYLYNFYIQWLIWPTDLTFYLWNTMSNNHKYTVMYILHKIFCHQIFITKRHCIVRRSCTSLDSCRYLGQIV